MIISRRSFAYLGLGSLGTHDAFSQATPELSRADGAWWKSLPKSSKYFYLVGYVDGSSKADAAWAYGSCRDKVSEKYRAAVTAGNDYTDIRLSQLIDGVDTFYADFRNLRIRVHDSMTIVRWQISGENSKMIDDSLELMRKTAMDPNY